MTTMRPPRGNRYRFAIATGLAVFITFAGAGIANAGWTAAVVNASASASAGTIGISQSGFASIAVQFSSTVLAKTAPITVTNTGTIPAPYTLTLGAAAANTLATTILVNTWPVASAANCLPGSAVPGTASSSNWGAVPAVGGSLGAGVAAVWCVRTSMTSAQVNANSGGSMTANLALTSNIGSWTSSVSATAVQSAVDMDPPTTPGAPAATGTTDTQTTLTWTASSDNVAVTGYEVYRGGVLVTTVATNTFTHTGLTPLSSNVYTIKARDLAGNTSAASPSTTVTTHPANPGRWYTVKSSGGLCLDGTGVATAALRFQTCAAGNQNQEWQILETSTAGNYKVTRRFSPALVWNVSSKGNNAPVSMVAATVTTLDEWQLSLTGSTFGFLSVYNTKCLDGTGAAVGGQAAVAGCGSAFTLTAVP